MVRHHVRQFGTHKIMAIKLVRELSHCGLAEAKDIVESCTGFFVKADAAGIERAAAEARRYGIEFDPPLDVGAGSYAASPLSSTSDSGSGGWSVRHVHGTQLINAIKLVREITGLGLKEAKDVVDNCGLVRTGISRHEAEDLARRFEAIGSKVEVSEGTSLPRPSPSRYDFENEADDDF